MDILFGLFIDKTGNPFHVEVATLVGTFLRGKRSPFSVVNNGRELSSTNNFTSQRRKSGVFNETA